MTSITDRFTEYLAHRRRFGADPASLERALKPFVTFADTRQAEWITTELFLQWKATFGSAGLNTWAARLSLLRGFARWLQAIDERNEVPPKGLIPRRNTRRQPWIYSEAEIVRIVATAATLPSPRGLRGCTYATLFGLLAVSGLRISEALGLDDQDIDAENAVLVIHHAKNGKSRVIPVTRCVIAKLQAYQQTRDRLFHIHSGALFCTESGKRLCVSTAETNFARIRQILGLRNPSPGKGRGPRIHDLRHTMATRTIIDGFRQGRDVDAEMYKLSTYLGHADPAGTWWYIEAVPELLVLATDRGLRALGEGGAS